MNFKLPSIDTASLVSFTIAVLILASAGSVLLLHTDLGWHLATGRFVLGHGTIPKYDPWSFNTGTYPWINPSWAWDCVAWILFSKLGLAALVMATIFLVAGAVAVMADTARQLAARSIITIVVLNLALICSLTYEEPEFPISISPQTSTLVLLAILHNILERRKHIIPSYLPLLFVLWGNIQGGFPAGLIAVAFSLFEQFRVARKLPQVKQIILAILCVLAPLLSPFGIGTYEVILRHFGSPAAPIIIEWLPFSFSRSPEMSLYILIFVLLTLGKRIVPSWPLLLQSVLWLFAGLQHQRHLAIFVITSAPLLASVLSDRRREITASVVSPLSIALAGVAVIISPVIVWVYGGKKIEFPTINYPKIEAHYLASHLGGRKLFNDWNLGSYLIFETDGQVPLFIDGRAEHAYPPEILKDLQAGPRFELYDRHNIDVVIFPRYRWMLVKAMDENPGWVREFEGPTAVVWGRRGQSKQM